MTTLLIVEDETAIRDMLAFALGPDDFILLQAENSAQADRVMASKRPDLILLDWMLPGESGVEYARRLKADQVTADIPIIMLTARSQEEDKIRGLEVGADDYVTKPFSPRELKARIKAVLRRTTPALSGETLSCNGLVVDGQSHRVTANGNRLELGPTEFRLLSFLMNKPDKVYTRSQLLDRVWGNNVYIEERTVDVHIRRLRKLLEPTGHDTLIQTVRGAGYRFSNQV